MTPISDTPRLEVADLRVVFPLPDGREAAAVDEVSFRIGAGETLGLVGESGSGKSVTALSIVRLIAPPGRVAAGRIRFEGRDLLAMTDDELRQVRGRRIGVVFQEPATALSPMYTVGFQIAETIEAHGLARGAAAWRRAEALLEAVRVPEPARRAREYPHELSGGLRQRVMIALALAGEPSLVIADEPTTALDATVQADVLDLLRDLQRQFALSLLLITHDIGVVASMADRIAVMYAGRIVEQAATAEVLHAPAHPYTRGLLASVPRGRAGERLTGIPGVVPALGSIGDGCAFAPRCSDRAAPCVTSAPGITATGAAHDVRCHLYPAAGTPAKVS